jgi:hypothetical protein
VIVVRLATACRRSSSAFHGGVLADRAGRRRLMVTRRPRAGRRARAGRDRRPRRRLPLWALVVPPSCSRPCASYFDPAYGAPCPALAGRDGVQAANALVRASADALWLGGSALRGRTADGRPAEHVLRLNAASFVLSALLLSRPTVLRAAVHGDGPAARARGVHGPAAAPVADARQSCARVAVTISSGTWIVGVPQFVRHSLHGGAGRFSLLVVAYALGSIGAGAILARRPLRRKARGALFAWCAYLPAYLLLALAHSLGPAFAGALLAGAGQGSAYVLTVSAAQTEIPDTHLGRVTGLISLIHRGAHATGLLLISPLFAVVAARTVFAGAALAIPLVGLLGAAVAARASRPSEPA